MKKKADLQMINLSQTKTTSNSQGGPTVPETGQDIIGAQKSMHRFDRNPTAKSQYFSTPAKEIGSGISVNVKPVSTAKAPPPKHNNFFLQKNNSSKKNAGAIFSGTVYETRKSKASKASQEQLSKQSSSVSSKRFGSMITISDNLQALPAPPDQNKSSMLKPSTTEKSTGSSSLNFKVIRPNDKVIPFSSASQEVNTALVSKGQVYRNHTLGSHKSQQVITKEGTEKTTCVASSEQLSKVISSQQKSKRQLKDTLTGDHSVKQGKVELSGNIFDSYGNSSLQVPMTRSIVRGNSGTFSKQLKAHRSGAPAAATTFSQEQELLQGTFRMFQTEMSQGRAAQRYASVDKEDLESHISLSPCVSEGAKPSSNRMSAKQKLSQEFLGGKTAKFSTLLSHMQNGTQAILGNSSTHKRQETGDSLAQQKINNFMGAKKSNSNRKEVKNAQKTQGQIKKQSPAIQVLKVSDLKQGPTAIQNKGISNETNPRKKTTDQEYLTCRQSDVDRIPEEKISMQQVSSMHKTQSVGDLYSTMFQQNSKTAVVRKENFEKLQGQNVADFYLTLTPKEPIEGKSSLTPNSKTTSSYRDSESLGFALSERKKVHQLKQLQLRQFQLQQKFQRGRDGGQLLNFSKEQVMLHQAMEKVNAAAIAAGQDMRNNFLLQLPERALMHQHQRIAGDPNEVKQAAARTLQRLQLEQNSDSPEFKQHPDEQDEHYYAYPTQHAGSMIAIQEQQDSEDFSQSQLIFTHQSLVQKDSHVMEISISPTKLNASRTKQKKKIIDREVIKYFKRMVKNQQIDKFKAQMNSSSQADINQERNLSPRQHQRGCRQQSSKKVKPVQRTGQDQLYSMSTIGQKIIVESLASDAVNHQSNSQELLPLKHPKKSNNQRQQKPEVLSSFFTTQQFVKSNDTQSTELRSLDPRHRTQDYNNTRKSVPKLPLELLNREAEQTGEEQVINIVTGGSFGRQLMQNHSSITQRPSHQVVETSVIPKQQPPDNTTERLEFQRTLKKAIVSLQQLQQATTKSTTGETPYNNHIKTYKSNRPERNLSNTSYGTHKQSQQTFPGKYHHHKSSLSLKNVFLFVENESQQKSQRDRLESYHPKEKSPKKDLSKKAANSMSPTGQNRDEVVVLPAHKKDEKLVFSLQHLKEPSGTPTVNMRKLVYQDSKIMAGNVAYAQCNTGTHASSFAREFDTFGRPSAQSQEQRKESSSILENSPNKDAERLETTTNDPSIRKLPKKKLKQLIPKPENSKRLRKVIKTKKKQAEQGKILSAGANTAPASVVSSKRCSTSHFGIQKSHQSSAAASKESSKRQSMVSSQSKRSPLQSSEAIYHINSQKAFKVQASSTEVMTTPMTKKSKIKKICGSGSILDTRRQPNLQKETCIPQNELKKKIGHIFKLQQHSAVEQTFENMSNANVVNSAAVKTANVTITKRRRQSIAGSFSINQQTQAVQQSRISNLDQQQPSLDIISPKGSKKQPKSRPSNKESSSSTLGQLYSQLNILMTKKEGSSGLLSITKERKTPKNQKVQKTQQKGSLPAQQAVAQISTLTSPNGALIEKKIKLNAKVVNVGADLGQVLGNSATQQLIAHTSKTIELQTPQTHVALSKPSHGLKKSEALLKKSNSSQQLLLDNTIHWQWQQMTQQQAPITAVVANQNGTLKLKKAIRQDSSSRKVELMQPQLSSMLINNQGKSSGKDSVTMQGRAGKSRNISDQCYQRDQINSEYNSQGKILFKTSGPVGGSRNSKQQFGTLGGLQTGQNNAQQYSSHSSLLKNNRDGLIEASQNGQVLSYKELVSGTTSQPHLQRESNLLRRLGNTQEHYQSLKKSMLSSTQAHLERPQLQLSTKQSSKIHKK